ncbi:histidine kinase dimerization/phospho-acceptor domain-containing protein [Pseudoalteromonas sp. B193]
MGVRHIHELRTPLTVLRSHLLAVQDGVFTADTKRINLLINQVDNLSHIVDDLAQLAQTDSVNLTYNNARIDLISIFEQSIENYTARFKERQLNVDSKSLTKASKCIINGDKERLIQLFSNLLENTCRYTHKGGQVIVLPTKDQ